MIYEGDVYRPPSEANSLIIQLTIGCARNTCKFCTMYKRKQFRIRELSEVIADLHWVKAHYPYYFDRVFLADGDALIFKTPDIITILDKIHELFPHVRRVTTYGAAKDVLRSKHVSNHLALAGTLNSDREQMLAQLERAIAYSR